MKHKLFATLTLLLLSCLSGNAQVAKLYNSRYNLSNNRIFDIYQDSNGFIWLPTGNGLTRFDGRTFHQFIHRDNDDTSIASNYVISVVEDHLGQMWVGSFEGLQILDVNYNRFKTFHLYDKTGSDTTACPINELLEIKLSNGVKELIAGSIYDGIFVIDVENLCIKKEKQDALNNSLRSKQIRIIKIDSKQRLWICYSDGGLSVCDAVSGKKLELIESILPKEKINFSSIEEDPVSGNIILGTYDNGLYIYEDKAVRFRTFKDSRLKEYPVFSLLYGSLPYKEDNRMMIVGTDNYGFKFINLDTETMVETPMSNVSYNTAHWKIHSLLRDVQGNLWAGAYQTGLYLIPTSLYGFDYTCFSMDMVEGENSSSITSIVEDPESECLWIGSDGGGLFKMDKLRKYEAVNVQNSALRDNSIQSLEIDKRGALWIATYHGGLIKRDKNGHYTSIEISSLNNPVQMTSVEYSLSKDIIYAGTYNQGLAVVDAKSNKTIRTVTDETGKWITSLHLDKNDMLWIGTVDGLYSYSLERNEVVKHRLLEGESRILVNSVSVRENGNIVVGCDVGLIEYNPESKNIKYFTQAEGLSNNSVMAVLEANDHTLWISTQYGLTKLNTADTTSFRYYLADGLQDNLFQNDAAYKAQDGTMYFGGVSGLTSFDNTSGEGINYIVPPIYFTGLYVKDRFIDYESGHNDRILDKHITKATSIELPYSDNSFTIRYAVPEFANPNRIVYSYRLLGADSEWTNCGTNKSVTFAKLDHGKYVLQVRAYIEGFENEYSEREIKVKIDAPFYLSAWAFILYLMILTLVAMFLLDLRRVITKKKDEKRQSYMNGVKLTMFTNLSHEIKAPLSIVLNELEKLRINDEVSVQKNPYSLIYRNTLRIKRTLDQVNDLKGLDDNAVGLNYVETEVNGFIKDIMKSFDSLVNAKNVEFSLNAAHEVNMIWTDQARFDMVMFNMITNAFRHVPQDGRISINIAEHLKNNGFLNRNVKKYINIIITVHGINLDEGMLGRIFECFYEIDSSDSGNDTAVGLMAVKQITELMYGKVWAKNTEEGVDFAVSMPLGNNHLNLEDLKSDEEDEEKMIVETEAVNPEDVAKDADTKAEVKSVEVQEPATFSRIEPKLNKNLEADFELRKLKEDCDYEGALMNVQGADADLYRECLKYIRENMSNPSLSVETLSEHVGISRVHMNRKLKERIDISPNSLIKSLRMKYAVHLLINEKECVSEVAYQVGYSTHSYFSSSFREHFGLTPKEFVAKHK